MLLRLSLAMAGVNFCFSECAALAEMFTVARHSDPQVSLEKVGAVAVAKHRVQKSQLLTVLRQ